MKEIGWVPIWVYSHPGITRGVRASLPLDTGSAGKPRGCVSIVPGSCMIEEQHVFVVDDDAEVRDSLGILLASAGLRSHIYASAKEFLADGVPKAGCVVADIRMPDMSGLELQEEIIKREAHLPVILMTAHADVPLAVRAMKAGAIDFIEKPFDDGQLIASIRHAFEVNSRTRSRSRETREAREKLSLLTSRERSVLEILVKGRSNKIAAYELGISPRTVEIHRAHIMNKLEASSLSDLVRIVLVADMGSEQAFTAIPSRKARYT
jgi:two-component system, LuxR family, response regulator FixJ